MAEIRLLDSQTIDKIAAGEVVERPVNVVKELVENAIDGGSTIINIEIKAGGIELIRVTDNGSGIDNSQVKTAFLRHATSKLSNIDDLDSLASLGFRGEALSSISAVSKTEMITKPEDALLGTRISVEGGKVTELSEIGAPKGTTVIVRQLFYNTPARKKFLKSPQVEGARIEEMAERIALSHPETAFSFTINGKTKFTTSGNGSVKDVIYRIFGREIYERLLEVNYSQGDNHVYGYIARPEYNLGTREFEIFLVNRRLVNSKELSVSVENGYKGFLMQHRFPFCVMFVDTDPSKLDVNIHPQKAEVRFSDMMILAEEIANAVSNALHEPELIPHVDIEVKNNEKAILVEMQESIPVAVSTVSEDAESVECESISKEEKKIEPVPQAFEKKRFTEMILKEDKEIVIEEPVYKQADLFEEKLISEEPIKEYRIIGQVFDTYWLITLNENLYIVDQHAAHEKVNYERFLKAYKEDKAIAGQFISPPVVLTLSPNQEVLLRDNMELFLGLGYEIEDFGEKSFAIRAVPFELYGYDQKELFMSLLDELAMKDRVYTPELILAKLASMSCKAAIKGNMRVSSEEMSTLMKELMKLDNPYNCPHGRPVFILITQRDLEKKFKRIV